MTRVTENRVATIFPWYLHAFPKWPPRNAWNRIPSSRSFNRTHSLMYSFRTFVHSNIQSVSSVRQSVRPSVSQPVRQAGVHTVIPRFSISTTILSTKYPPQKHQPPKRRPNHPCPLCVPDIYKACHQASGCLRPKTPWQNAGVPPWCYHSHHNVKNIIPPGK